MSRRVALALSIPPLAFLLLFFVWPIIAILATGLAPDGWLDTAGIADAWARPWLLDTIVFTIGLAMTITACSLLVGLPAAWVFARFTFPGRRVLRALFTIPFVLPTVVVAAAFLALLGPRGAINQLLAGNPWFPDARVRLDDSAVAVVIAGVFFNVAVVSRLVGGLWAHIDPRMEEAARALGASPWRAFREVTWPLLRPAVLSAASIVFLFSVTSFALVLLLGAPGQPTLEVEIWRQTAIMLNLTVAAALVVIQLVGIGVLLVVHARWQERLTVAQRLSPSSEVARPARTRRERVAVAGIVGGLSLFLGLPLLALVERSFASGSGYSDVAWQALLHTTGRSGLSVPPVAALADSLVFATATLLIAGTLGAMIAIVIGYRTGWLPRAFDALVMLPLGTSAVIVGFGFLIALDQPPIDLRASVLLIPIAHSLVALPFVVRAMAPVIRAIDPRRREAAAVLGASPRRVWQEVDAPLVARATLVGAGFAFAISLGEFGATLFIARPDTPTLPIAIDRLLSQPGALNFGQAMALSTILMALSAASMLVIERWRTPGSQAF
ncbi:MAG: iron ABC transporter permease [Chloroflexi bacterium]|nr:iron ABC transporter permease [Chloroflexota bacterium]